jgi:hypothetical protein
MSSMPLAAYERHQVMGGNWLRLFLLGLFEPFNFLSQAVRGNL